MPSSIVASSTSRYRLVSVVITVVASATESGSGRASWRASTTNATKNVSTARAALAHTIRIRRSWRSVITPAGSENSSQGSRWATATTAISKGLRVIADASHG